MFKVGDKVIHCPSGLVYQVEKKEGWKIFVSTQYVDDKGVWNKVVFHVNEDQCEPYHENKPIPVSERLPSAEDTDKFGEVFALFDPRKESSTGWTTERINNFSYNSYTHWMHTPDWTPREPLLDSCDYCKDYGEFKHHVSGCTACWKHKTFYPKPFYTDSGTPCHLEEE